MHIHAHMYISSAAHPNPCRFTHTNTTHQVVKNPATFLTVTPFIVPRAHGDAVTCSSTGSKDKGGRRVLSSEPGAMGFFAFAMRCSSSRIEDAKPGTSS